MSKQPASARLATYFVPATGIDREVITTDICRYLGNDALVKPGTHKNSKGEPVQGYFITAYRALTTDQLTDIKADSARWGAERARNQANRGSQGGGISPLRDSDMGVRSSNITPDGYRSSLTRAGQQPQQQWGETTPPQGSFPMAMPPQQSNQPGDYNYRAQQQQQPQPPYGAQQDYNPPQNYSYGQTVPYSIAQAPQQQHRPGFPPQNPVYGDGRGMNPGYPPDNRAPPQGYYDPLQSMPQGRGQPIPPQQQFQRDSLPAQDPYYNPRGPQDDQPMEYDYDEEFPDPQGQPPQQSGAGQTRHRSDRDSERRAERHTGKQHRR